MADHVVFLYSEMAGYFQSCVKALAKAGVQVTVFHWPVNPEAPFKFDQIDGVEFKDRSQFDTAALTKAVQALQPKAIVTSGWMDKGYTKVVSSFKKRIPTLLIIDNHWTGSLKLKTLCALSSVKVRDKFTHSWVAGEPQAVYAYKLGFKNSEILKGFYSADIALFNSFYPKKKELIGQSFPKVFVYVGRYVRHKGIFEMWEAFSEANKAHGEEWQLWCLGTGDEYENRVESANIKHFGFVQPSEMEEIVSKAGVFVLPSKFEPWGVVVHEFAAAGFPLLLSKAVGASSHFLESGKNGMEFDISDLDAFKASFSYFMRLSNGELSQMSERSHDRGQSISPQKWVDTLRPLL